MYAFIGCYLQAAWPAIKPTTLACGDNALTNGPGQASFIIIFTYLSNTQEHLTREALHTRAHQLHLKHNPILVLPSLLLYWQKCKHLDFQMLTEFESYYHSISQDNILPAVMPSALCGISQFCIWDCCGCLCCMWGGGGEGKCNQTETNPENKWKTIPT